MKNISRPFQGQLFSIYIAKIRNFLSKNDAEKCIHAFVTSRLDYCNALLSGYPDKAPNKLQLVLNTAARILTRTFFFKLYYSSASLYTGFLLRQGLIQGFTANLQSITWACSYLSLSDLVLPYIPTRTLRSQDAGLLIVPRISKQTAGGRAFSYRAPFSTFKSLLKTHLFSGSYD